MESGRRRALRSAVAVLGGVASATDRGRRIAGVGGGVAAAIGAGALGTRTARAQTAGYPSKPIRFVVPYPAGGGTDIVGRLVGTRLAEAWGQNVVVENRVGASGMIGNELVARAAPDGHTVLIGITTLIQMPHLGVKVPYDAFRDLVPVTQLAYSADLFVVPAASPAGTLKEYVDLVRAQPGRHSYGSYGNGTSSHVHGEMLKAQARIDLAHVPFKGGAPLLTDLIGGQISSAFVDVTSARAHLAGGKMKVLAITGERRYRALPDVPTFTELGYADFEPYGWFAMLLPGGTPPEIVARLSSEVARILKLPDVAARIDDLGLQPGGNTPEQFAAAMKRDHEVWGRVIRAANIKAE